MLEIYDFMEINYEFTPKLIYIHLNELFDWF
jgi:hypothetical protein